MLVEKTGIHRRKGHFWEQKREVPCVGRVLPPASQAMAYTMVLEAFSRLNLELLPPPCSAGPDLRPTSEGTPIPSRLHPEGVPIRLGIVKV